MEDYNASPQDFADAEFALNNKDLFDTYIEYSIRGIDDNTAFRLTFGEEYSTPTYIYSRIFGLKRNPYYIKRFKERFAAIPIKDIWNPKTSVRTLAMIALDESAKANARIAAVKELNVILGITMVDSEGITKRARGLDDFYKDIDKNVDTLLNESIKH